MNGTGRRHCSRPTRHRDVPRRGMALLVALLLIAVAMATSYSAMRSQTMAIRLQENADLAVRARQNAMTGLGAAIKAMHSPQWEGVGTTWSGQLGPADRFDVDFHAGDERLVPTDPEFGDLPYRVTLRISGWASDEADARLATTCKLTAVARLVPRAMADEPQDWEEMTGCTFYQTRIRRTTLNLPCRIEGRVRLQSKLLLAPDYPTNGQPWVSYLGDLQAMRAYDFPDLRPLTGRIAMPFGLQDADTLALLQTRMGVSATDAAPDISTRNWLSLENANSYRIYPGGPEYVIPEVGGQLANVTLEPDPQTNPLGLLFASGDVTLADDVTVRGTLFCKTDVIVSGMGVNFEAAELPELQGTSIPIQLPAVVCRTFSIRPGTECAVEGLLLASSEFTVEAGSGRGRISVEGAIVSASLSVGADQRWADVDWPEQHSSFTTSVDTGSFPWPLFPVWMDDAGYDATPTVRAKPREGTGYHWHSSDSPIFVPHPDDFSPIDASEQPGLRWELIELRET